ncbi:MAG: 3-phosphoshikimate 1-carboxyvinyltransferase [Halobacteriales archaeon]|nr:3-phosphoshikimate 1-carboxyvinyltransferase [Halobacteriales archaeon]
MTSLRIRPGQVSGTVAAPPSKSVTHRAYLLAALSDAPATIASPLVAADTNATLACLHAVGANFRVAADAVHFEPAPLRPPVRALDCANSGTTLRFMSATAARLPVPVALVGDESLGRRSSAPLLEALHTLGARIRSNGGAAPISMQGPIRPGTVGLPAHCSSQFASALLLSLPMLPAASHVTLAEPIASRPYLDLTLEMAARAGLRHEVDAAPGATRIVVPGGQVPRLGAVRVEGDWSAAAFPFAAAALTGGRVTVTGLDTASRQGDRAILAHLRAFGCKVDASDGHVTVEGPDRLASPGSIDVAATPDLFPVLAVLAAASRGTTAVTGGSQLRGKESDRVAAMAEGLRRMGIAAHEAPDGLVVHGGTLRGAQVASRDDHRIHMAFAVAGLAALGDTFVDGAASAAVSYPGFHADLQRLSGRAVAEVAP